MSIIKMSDLNLKNKKIFIRSDLNVPIEKNIIISDARIKASLPTIQNALKKGGKVMITSHLGCPIEGKYDNKFSLKPIADYLEYKLNYPTRLLKNYLNGINITGDELIVLENVRFNKEETNNGESLSKKYASLCDIYVMDAFASAHRIQASTYGVAKFAPIACAGPLLFNELNILNKILKKPMHPVVTIIGGSKISTKLNTLNALAKISDRIIVGGGIANTFIASKGYKIGISLYEKKFISKAKKLLNTYNIFIPTDVRVSTNFSKTKKSIIKSINDIKDDEQILDLGDQTIQDFISIIKNAKTILWNGPVGAFELPNFRYGTKLIAKSIAESKAFSIAGGGDTISAIDMFGIRNKISYISTGGGAFLEFIKSKKLPIVLLLEERSKEMFKI